MKRKALIAVVVACAFCVSLIGLGLGSLLNTVTFKGQIGPGSSMEAVTLNLGYIINGSSGGSGTSGNGSPFNTNETITLATPVNVTIAFDNVSNVESAFTVFDVLIQFDQSGTPIVQGSINENIPSFTISNVPSGTYEIFVGYTYTAGANPTTFNIPIDISQ